jgi:hypothetical protein
MILEDDAHRKADIIHKQNTENVLKLLRDEFDLTKLDKILDPGTAEIYKRLIPRHAELAELDQKRGLNDVERAELAVSYASLYPTFGDEGIIQIAALWIGTRPKRQARGS